MVKLKTQFIFLYIVVEEGSNVKNSFNLTKCIFKKGVEVENTVIDKFSTIKNDVINFENQPVYIFQGKKVKLK